MTNDLQPLAEVLLHAMGRLQGSPCLGHACTQLAGEAVAPSSPAAPHVCSVAAPCMSW